MIFDVEILINERYVLCYNMILLSIYEESTFSVRVTNENKLTYAFGLLLQFHIYADIDFESKAIRVRNFLHIKTGFVLCPNIILVGFIQSQQKHLFFVEKRLWFCDTC